MISPLYHKNPARDKEGVLGAVVSRGTGFDPLVFFLFADCAVFRGKIIVPFVYNVILGPIIPRTDEE